jgi:parallel beta-helix repeat protein
MLELIYVQATTPLWVILLQIITNNEDGIGLASSNYNIITYNTLSNNDDGVRLVSSEFNTITENYIPNNDNGISLVDSSNNNNIFANNISFSTAGGICLLRSSDNTISWNNCSSNNNYGIRLSGSTCINNVINSNSILNNDNKGIYIWNYHGGMPNDNVIFHNYFINNTPNTYDECTNFWYNTTLQEGNYYDDYTGTDSDGDGIGDTPYDIPGGSNQDLYPLGYFQNIPPTANFTYNPSSPTDLDIIQFTDASTDSDGVIVNWTWDFDDGNISYLQNPTHQYADDGTYLVNLTVMDNDYEYDSLNRLITVTNVPPEANFTYSPLNPTDLDTVQFTDSSYDLDGDIVNYTWDFDDGNISYEQNPTHQYGDDGAYHVTLIVKDDDGATDSISKDVIVSNVPPVADANGPYSGYVYQLIQFYGSGSYDLDGAIVSYDWNFGDGHIGTGVNPTHTYTSTGTFIVTLTVEDDDGDADTNYSVAVIYTYQYPPVADADGPYEGQVGESIQFYGSATGGSKPYSWHWTFGDGHISNIQNPTHSYDEAGVYSVVLKVTGNNGKSDSDTTTATIHPADTLIADAGGPYSDYVNETIPFHGSASGGEPPYSWYWEFGDGDTSTLQNPAHIYDTTGEYTAVLTVTDDFGQTDNDTASVTITEEDTTRPTVKITKPEKGIYVSNNKVMSFFMTILIGDIDIEVDASDDESGMNRVEFYINDVLKETDATEPYSWTWDERAFGKRIIRVTAYDNAGNSASDEIKVWKIF